MRFVRKRLTSAFLVLLGASFITFALARIIPSDPILAYMGPKATPAESARLRTILGLDQPIPIQYGKYLVQTLRGNWGYSLSTKQSVLQEISSRLPSTLELIFFAMLFALLIGVALGVYAAKYQGRYLDSIVKLLEIGRAHV